MNIQSSIIPPSKAGQIVVLIPAYNEARTIADVATRVRQAGFSLIVVDDGSPDGTADALAGFDLRLIRHEVNQGKAGSLMTGFAAALEDDNLMGVVTLDGDGQHRPEDIERIVEAARQAPEHIVIGSRLGDRENFPADRLRANEIANFWISWAAGYAVEDSQSGFRYYPAALLRRIDRDRARARGFVFESEILIQAARLGIRSVPVPIPALYDDTDRRPSHFRPVADIVKIVRMVAWKLISRGMYPQGLYRAERERRAARL